jgi:hypothetical protein
MCPCRIQVQNGPALLKDLPNQEEDQPTTAPAAQTRRFSLRYWPRFPCKSHSCFLVRLTLQGASLQRLYVWLSIDSCSCAAMLLPRIGSRPWNSWRIEGLDSLHRRNFRRDVAAGGGRSTNYDEYATFVSPGSTIPHTNGRSPTWALRMNIATLFSSRHSPASHPCFSQQEIIFIVGRMVAVRPLI